MDSSEIDFKLNAFNERLSLLRSVKFKDKTIIYEIDMIKFDIKLLEKMKRSESK